MWYASIPYYLNILPPYFFRELIHHQCVTENFLLDAEAYWLPWVEGAIATVPGWIICIWKSNKILIKILLTVSCVVVVFFSAKIYVFVLYKMAFHFLIFNFSILFDFRMQIIQPGTVAMAPSAKWKSVNFSIQQKVICDALLMD